MTMQLLILWTALFVARHRRELAVVGAGAATFFAGWMTGCFIAWAME